MIKRDVMEWSTSSFPTSTSPKGINLQLRNLLMSNHHWLWCKSKRKGFNRKSKRNCRRLLRQREISKHWVLKKSKTLQDQTPRALKFKIRTDSRLKFVLKIWLQDNWIDCMTSLFSSTMSANISSTHWKWSSHIFSMIWENKDTNGMKKLGNIPRKND